MKIRSVLALVGIAISFALPIVAQAQNTVDPEVRQQIEAALLKFEEAFNKHDAAAMATLFTVDAVQALDWGERWYVFRSASHRETLHSRFRIEPPRIRRKAYSGVCHRRQNIRYLGMESRSMEGLPRKDLCS
jgi:hypothetical protein